MGLSRRIFTGEFKLAAVERLGQGASVGEVARAFEVNPNVIHRWRREFRDGPGNAFPGVGRQRWEEGRGNWNARSGSRKPCPACRGGIQSEKDLAALPGAKVIRQEPAFASSDPSVNAFTRVTVQRNLYRIPLP